MFIKYGLNRQIMVLVGVAELFDTDEDGKIIEHWDVQEKIQEKSRKKEMYRRQQ